MFEYWLSRWKGFGIRSFLYRRKARFRSLGSPADRVGCVPGNPGFGPIQGRLIPNCGLAEIRSDSGNTSGWARCREPLRGLFRVGFAACMSFPWDSMLAAMGTQFRAKRIHARHQRVVAGCWRARRVGIGAHAAVSGQDRRPFRPVSAGLGAVFPRRLAQRRRNGMLPPQAAGLRRKCPLYAMVYEGDTRQIRHMRRARPRTARLDVVFTP